MDDVGWTHCRDLARGIALLIPPSDPASLVTVVLMGGGFLCCEGGGFLFACHGDSGVICIVCSDLLGMYNRVERGAFI